MDGFGSTRPPLTSSASGTGFPSPKVSLCRPSTRWRRRDERQGSFDVKGYLTYRVQCSSVYSVLPLSTYEVSRGTKEL